MTRVMNRPNQRPSNSLGSEDRPEAPVQDQWSTKIQEEPEKLIPPSMPHREPRPIPQTFSSHSMASCPHCSAELPDNANECPQCGRRPPVVGTPGSDPRFSVEPSARDLARLTEIRRLQRIASGVPTKSDRLTRAKGLMALIIMIKILAYAYVWKSSRSTEVSGSAVLTYEVFNAAFGLGSPLTEAARSRAFKDYRGHYVAWEGTVVYVNLGTGKDLYASIRHRSDSPTSDVLLRFRESNRTDITGLPVGVRIRYRGRLHDFGAGGSGFITLFEGRILERLDRSNPSQD